MTSIRFVLKHPTLRLIAAALLLLGAHNASVYPYQSVIAIERIGMSKPAFSLMLALASVIAVTSSVMFGILGDQHGRRRAIALITALCSTVDIGLMLVFPGLWALVLCQGVLLPLASSIYGQLFALARLASPGEGATRTAVLSTIRSAMSFSFLAMLIFWTFAFGFGLSELAVYVSGGLASLGMSLLVLLGWPRDGRTAWADPRSGMRLHHALAEIARPHVALRVVLLGALASAGNLYMVLISLVFDASQVRGPADVALYVGLVAGFEVPAMLIVPRFAHLMPRSTLMAVGGLIYGCHLLALPLLAGTPWLWGMTVFAGFGGAVIITTPISYYQDLLSARPGAAASMLAVQKLVADVLTAAIFALGSQVGGFETVAVMGVAVSLCGGLGVYLADRQTGLAARV
ncbi:MFS transporter [bacterium]|nr:MFS transporter [bacterium]